MKLRPQLRPPRLFPPLRCGAGPGAQSRAVVTFQAPISALSFRIWRWNGPQARKGERPPAAAPQRSGGI